MLAPTILPSTEPITVLVTGATGFVGRALTRHLAANSGVRLRSVVRGRPGEQSVHGEVVSIGNLTGYTDWSEALRGVDVVVHVAARTQIDAQAGDAALAEFNEVNVAATINLAEQALAGNVRRFVFISSVKVLGEASGPERGLSEADAYAPQDAYGHSKMQAERSLQTLLGESGLEWVIVRPPLVYGPGMQSNFAALMRAVRYRLPMPLGAIRNRRSFISLDNLVDFIDICVHHPSAANQVWMASDGGTLSTPDLIRAMARAQGVRPLLLPVPAAWLRGLAALLRKPSAYQRLCGDLAVDSGKAKEYLGWNPRVSLEEGLRRVVAGAVEL